MEPQNRKAYQLDFVALCKTTREQHSDFIGHKLHRLTFFRLRFCLASAAAAALIKSFRLIYDLPTLAFVESRACNKKGELL